MISAIIFSKDRASQLNLLLDSIRKNCSHLFDITIIYSVSGDEFQEGYDLLQRQSKNIRWIKQQTPPSDFKKITLEAINQSDKYVCFFTDDDIVYRRIDTSINSVDALFEHFNDKKDLLLCLSLRLGSNTIVQSQYRQTTCPFPDTKIIVNNGEYVVWDWTKIPTNTNFGYPFSVDGHIYKTKRVLEMITYDFDTPNNFEQSDSFNRQTAPPFMARLDKSVVVNDPINIVGSSKNKAGEVYGIELRELNRLFLSGRFIDLDAMDFSNVKGCHQEIQYHFESKN
jgi:hypothetical protein